MIITFFRSKKELPIHYCRFAYNHGSRCTIGYESCWFNCIQSVGHQFGSPYHCRYHCIEENLLQRSSWWDNIPCCICWSQSTHCLFCTTASFRSNRKPKWSISLLLRLPNPIISIIKNIQFNSNWKLKMQCPDNGFLTAKNSKQKNT